MSKLIGIDIGTTHWKAGLFDDDGSLLRLESIEADYRCSKDGLSCFEPETLWEEILLAVKNLVKAAGEVDAIGVTGMAEGGVLLNKKTLHPVTKVIPWFFRGSVPQAEKIDAQVGQYERFIKTGLHNSYKYGISKLLWIKENLVPNLKGCIWLSVPDYIAFRLTGNLATDYTLAARTYAFDINKYEWDEEFLECNGMSSDLFPKANSSGTVIGSVNTRDLFQHKVGREIPVAICGHDHLCASAAVGALTERDVFSSIGTAAVLLGNFKKRSLEEKDFISGLSYGPHVLEGRMAWLGSIQAAGGSLEWFRGVMDQKLMSYDVMNKLLYQTPARPTGILYYPYLTGSGVPKLDINVKASLVGLRDDHGKSEILRGVLEGIAYEMKCIKDTAEKVQYRKIGKIIALGGGTKISGFMQVLADILDIDIKIPVIREATIAGAALLSAKGAGIIRKFGTLNETVTFETEFFPEAANVKAYKRIYETGYIKLQEPLRGFFKEIRQDVSK